MWKTIVIIEKLLKIYFGVPAEINKIPKPVKCSKPCETFKMERFAKIAVNYFRNAPFKMF